MTRRVRFLIALSIACALLWGLLIGFTLGAKMHEPPAWPASTPQPVEMEVFDA